MSRRRDPHTKNLFDWEAEPVAVGYEGDVAGRGGTIASKVSRVVSRALRDAKDAGMMRADVTRKMAEYAGRPVPAGGMERWSSEAEDRCIPLDWFIALVHATDQHELLGFVPEIFGFAVVPNRFVELIELHQIREHKAEVEAREKALEAKVRSRR